MDSHQLTGIGLRPEHFQDFTGQMPDIGWIEVHSENYFNRYGLARQVLRQLAEHYPISLHGIGLSLGSAQPLDQQHIQQLVELEHEIQPVRVSDHLSWSAVDGKHYNDLLPLPYTEEALRPMAEHILQVQEQLRRPLLIENPSSYLGFQHSVMPEWEFLQALHQMTDCRFLFDINNIYVTSANTDLDTSEYLSRFAQHPAIDEIHLAGFTRKQTDLGEVLIDTHSRPVHADVWQLYADFVQRRLAADLPIPATLIEWDLDLPQLPVLLAEASKARDILELAGELPEQLRVG